MIFGDHDLRLKKSKKSQNKFGGFNYLLYLCNTKRNQETLKIMESNKNQNKVKKGAKIYHAYGILPDISKEKDIMIYIPPMPKN